MIATYDNFIGGEYVWMDGFDAAVYDSIFNRYPNTGSLNRLGLFACAAVHHESPLLPPYCKISVDSASHIFEDGVIGLQKYVDGYNVASGILQQESRGVVHV